MWTKPPVWLAVRSVLRPVAQPQQAAQVHLRQRAPASSSPRFFFLAATRLPPSQNAASSDGTLSLRTCLDAVGSASAPAVLGASRARGLHLLASRPQRISRRTAGFDAAAQVSGRRGVLQSASHHLEDNSGDEEPRGLTDVQKRLLFIQAAVPMIGFGFMDNMVMIFMGDLIDSTLGVTFGLSTLTAAGFGQIFSDVSGVCFGGTVEALFNKLGLPHANLTGGQMRMRSTKMWTTLGACIGVTIGCLFGMSTLLFTRSGTEDAKHDAEFAKMLQSEDKSELKEYMSKMKQELSKAEAVIHETEKTIASIAPSAISDDQAQKAEASLLMLKVRRTQSASNQQPGGGKQDSATDKALAILRTRTSTSIDLTSFPLPEK